MKRILFISGLMFIIIPLLIACGNGEEERGQESWVDDHGYGPVDQPVEIGELNTQLASEGHTIFNTYCTACHALDASISGPALRSVVDNRTPEYVMNYILNPGENRENHPIGQELSEQYTMIMADMGLNRDQAIAIYEYLRYYNEHREDPPAE